MSHNCSCMELMLPSSQSTTGWLLLEQGDFAGRRYCLETSICPNPVCQCARVTLRCSPELATREPNLAEAIRRRFQPFGGVDDLEPHPPVTVGEPPALHR